MNYSKIEKKWQNAWEKEQIYQVDENSKKPKFYCLSMYPYPSGSGLHIGHASNFSITDVFSRFKRMQGFNVLHPMGFDSFGLPAENAAIKNNSHPRLFTEKAIKNFIRQMKELGLSYDWSRMIYSHDPNYYKWNQWLFLQMFKKGLAYKKTAPVNWCSECNTVLANEQVVNGCCWRHEDKEVEIKELNQWFYKTTDYAKDLVKDLEKLDWPEEIKQMQRNWIGESEGTIVNFKLKDTKEDIPIFTTRIDTIYGVTFMVFAPEHSKVQELVKGTKYEKKVKEFTKKVMLQGKFERTAEDTEKEGLFIGKYAINPLTKEEVPIYIGNFVVPDYGGGAVMAVPAHDQRDFEFAKKYDIPIKEVITPKDKIIDEIEHAYIEDGILINSNKFNGLSNRKAIQEITKYLEKKKLGKATTNYRLRDWLLSRQRYWGTPIPILYCDKCGLVPEKEKNLPIKLPEDVNFKSGGNPLETSEEYKNAICPKCKGKAKRETDTMDTFIDSSWYFLRYLDPNNEKEIFSKKKANYWMPIDLYIGGKEHATGHLIYSRFITKVLKDLKLIKTKEPIQKLFNQGMLHKNGVVMSKSKGNVVSQEEISEKYGIDTARFFLFSISSPEKDKEWNDKRIEGSFKVINKILPLTEKEFSKDTTPELENIQNKTIKNITETIEKLQYNLSTIHLTDYINFLSRNEITRESIEVLSKLISPFMPHLAEELWEKLGNKKFVLEEKWPKCDESKINPEIDAQEELVKNTINDVKAIMDLVKIVPKKATISVAEGWKYELIKNFKEELKKTRELSKLIKKVMVQEHAKEISKIIPSLLRNESKIPKVVLSQQKEFRVLEKNKELLEKELNIEIEIKRSNERAMPSKPAIKIE
ncbi:leucine--tRNA ligase [Candidatus Woesearchaeota archaeon]|jgi:leucyl-tRNA synthetase|nr:leucine--tRNA ligase [Candidatus Woesearchaeota archaeon]MBT4631257.1 leucine--tRNA ligase [Candidatus Woesearchaeota archaeon]